MRQTALLLLALSTAHAQTRFTPSEADLKPPIADFRCDVEPITPELNFDFRFQTGYVVKAPLSQFRGPGHSFTMLLRVTPQATRRPVYLSGKLDLPETPNTTITSETAGTFLLGEGAYDARLTVIDETGRGCVRDWSIIAQLKPGQRAAKLPMPPGAVSDLSESDLAPADSDGPRLTILLHAAPVRLRAAAVPPEDAERLLGAVSALMHQARVNTARLIAFNLDQQREIYRNDAFSLGDLQKLSQSIYSLQLALIDYKSMRDSTPADFLSSLVDSEIVTPNPSNAVVFLGPRGRGNAILRKNALDGAAHHPPAFFYLEYEQWKLPVIPPLSDRMPGRGGRGGGRQGGRGGDRAGSEPTLFQERPDLLQQAVSALKGKTFVVHDAGEFAKAIEQIRAVSATASRR